MGFSVSQIGFLQQACFPGPSSFVGSGLSVSLGTQLQTAVATSQSSCHATSAASDVGSFFPALLPAVSGTASSSFSPYVPEINLCLPQTWLFLYMPYFACGISFPEPKLGAAIVSTLILTHGHSSCPVLLSIVSQIWSSLWFVAVGGSLFLFSW